VGVVLDTSVLIAAERGRFDLDRLLAAPGIDGVAVAAISLSELLVGAARAQDPALRNRRLVFAEWVAAELSILSFGAFEARAHAILVEQLLRAGTPIGAGDTLIAATALANGLEVATLDAKHFTRVPGLRIVETGAFVRE
jgi:tRNA(fMet)-specific endonuclease VapC